VSRIAEAVYGSEHPQHGHRAEQPRECPAGIWASRAQERLWWITGRALAELSGAQHLQQILLIVLLRAGGPVQVGGQVKGGQR
jgi:hypothetical protein